MSLVYVSRMLKMKLGAGLEVALYLMSQSDYGGMCMAKNSEVAKELGMTATYVCTLIGRLHHKGVLHKVGPRTVFLNPAFLFRGSAQEQHRALERWSKYRRDLMQQENAEPREDAA